MCIKLTVSCMGFFCLFFNPAFADTSVWKITKNNNHLYLGGTVHILADSDYPLPAAYDHAYRRSQKLIFETDLQKLQDPVFQQGMLASLSYKNGKTMADVLSADTYQRLQAYCASRGIQLSTIHAFRPGLLTTVLLVTELQRLGLSGEGVDYFYDAKARRDGKSVGELETADQQVAFLVNMGLGEEDAFIEYSLDDLSRLPSLMASMKAAWRDGDMAELKRIAFDPYLKQFPSLMDNLLSRRNQAWMPKIESMLKTGEVELVLVGALHLVGKQGLLNQLRSRGYIVEQH